MSIKAGAELSDDIKGAALIHGAFIDESDANAVKVPVLFLPSKGEADQVNLTSFQPFFVSI